MKLLLQRVISASVSVDNKLVGGIQQGLLVFLGVDKGDDQAVADKLLKKLLAYRMFADNAGKMNLSVSDIKGGVLLVSQFTLSADTKKGNRPSFSSAAAPELAENIYEYMLAELVNIHMGEVASGQFAADMEVSLVNDGPVTFWLD